MNWQDFSEFVINCAHDAIFVLNEEGEFVYFNASAVRMTGYSREELAKMSVFQLDAKHTPDELWDNWKRLYQEKTQTVETLIRRKNGEEFPAEILSTLIVFENKHYCCSSVRDISERLKSEEALRISNERLVLAGKATNDPIYDWNIVTNIVTWSDSARHLFKHEFNESESTLEFWYGKIHDDDRDRVLKSLYESVESNKPFWSGEYRFRCGDGQYKTVLDRGYIIFDQNCKPLRMIGTMLDITERKAFEAHLLEAKTKAEEATRAKSEFLANISHEIRTPLNALVGSAYLLRSTNLTPEQNDFVETMLLSSNTLLSLVENVLDLGKIEAGRLELEHEPVDVREIINNAVNLLADKAYQKQLPLEVFIEPNLPVIESDSIRLQQILTNLLSNAIKFTDKGQVSLHCRQLSRLDGMVELEFAVQDTGIGIPPEGQERIFEMFSQLESNHNRRYGGCGLGLAISRRLVELMGGKLTVESTPGKGSRFSFTIRARVAQNPESATAARLNRGGVETAQTEFDPTLGQRYPLKLLVAEDSRVNAHLLQQILAKFGYGSHLVRNGLEAVEACRNAAYDIVFMDVQMPVLDGLSAARTIRDEMDPGGRMFLVAVTASATHDDLEESRRAGMNDYISKPYGVQDIRNCLKRAIERKVGHPPSPPESETGQ